MINRRKVGMTSSHHGPYGQGYTRATMVYTEGSDLARASGTQKVRRSPDRSLQLDSVKSESLVIANQNVAVNTFPGLFSECKLTLLRSFHILEELAVRLHHQNIRFAIKAAIVCF